MNVGLQRVFDKSEELLHLLNQPFTSGGDEGDEYISKVEKLLQERGELIQSLTIQDATKEEEKMAIRLIDLNKIIESKLDTIKNQVKFDINHMTKKKKTNRKYENSYDGPTADGVFFDKRGV
jgi:flagellar protein FliT